MPAFHSFCIVADDLSGAADCAAALAARSGPVPVFLDAADMQGECLALDTDSRSMNAAAAVAATARAFERIARDGDAHRLVYKKIDSTLRGHVGAELAAALRALPQCAGAVVAPAFPQQGRTLVHGRLRVQGRAADGPGHAGDLVAMLEAADLRTVLVNADGSAVELRRRIGQALDAGARAIAVDAADQDGLARIAAALAAADAPRLLVAGSAGLAKALAAHLPPPAGGAGAAAPLPQTGPVLAIVGSFSPASIAQVAQVEAADDAMVVRLTAPQWAGRQHADLRHGAIERARHELCHGRDVLFAIAGDVVQPFSRSPVEAMAAVLAPLLRDAATCVLTGGDTARAVFHRMEVRRIDVGGEFEPGISLARAASCPATRFILKAGGFGDALALQRIIRRFGRPTTARQAAPR